MRAPTSNFDNRGADLQRTYGNRKLSSAIGNSDIPRNFDPMQIVQRAEKYSSSAPQIQRKIEGIQDTAFFNDLKFYNNEGMLAKGRYLQSYFDAFVRRDEAWGVDDFLDSCESPPFGSKPARKEIAIKKEKVKQSQVVSSSKREEPTTSSPTKKESIPVSVETPKKMTLEEALDTLVPSKFSNLSKYMDEVKNLTGLDQKKVYQACKQKFEEGTTTTATPELSSREQRLNQMKEKAEKEKSTSTAKGPDDTNGYTVNIPDAIRSGAKKEGFETELDDWANDISTTSGHTRGQYKFKGTLMQHYWIGSTDKKTVFYEVIHGTSTVEVIALAQHVGSNNKYTAYASIPGYNFKEI